MTLIKQVYQNHVLFGIIGTLKMFDLNLNRMFVINVMTDYELKTIAILNVKRVDFSCILWGINRNEAINRMNNSVLFYRWILVKRNCC